MTQEIRPRRTTCRDCAADLVWIQILDDSDDFRSVSGLRFFDAASPERGVIHGARCPLCGEVSFFAFPSYGQPLPENVFEAERQRRARAELAASLVPSTVDGPRPAIYALVARFADRLTPDPTRAKSLSVLVKTAEPDVWVPLVAREVGALAADSAVIPVAVTAFIELKEARAVAPLGVLLGIAPWAERVRILDALVEFRGDASRVAVLDGFGAALRDGLPEVARAAIQALRRLGFPAGAEPLLNGALNHEHVGLLVAAVEALGEVGSRTTISTLRGLTKGYFRDRVVKQAAQKAIDRLNERLGMPAGGLSVIEEATDGALTLADEGGKLSMATEESHNDEAERDGGAAGS